MAEKQFKYVQFVTEVMTARYPALSEPDTEGENADGKYKTEAIADEDYTERFKRSIQAVANTYFAGKKDVHLPWKEAKEGAIAFNFKSPKKKPQLVDAKGNPLRDGIVIRGGSLIRIVGVMAAWQKGGKSGVSLWPDAVRVIKLSGGLDFTGAFGPPEDGFDGTKR